MEFRSLFFLPAFACDYCYEGLPRRRQVISCLCLVVFRQWSGDLTNNLQPFVEIIKYRYPEQAPGDNLG